MREIIVIDIAGAVLVLCAAGLYIRQIWQAHSLREKDLFILAFLAVLLAYFVSLVLERVWEDSALMQAEDFIGVLLPMFWLMVFYLVLQENREKKLVESESLHRKFIENQPVGLCRTLLADGGRYLMANKAMATMLGYESVEQLKKEAKVVDIYKNTQDRDWVVSTALATGRVGPVEVIGKRRDGLEIVALITGFLVYDYSGSPVALDGTLQDITEKKRTESALAFREKLHRNAQQIAKLGHWEFGCDETISVWSDEMYRIFELNLDNGDDVLKKPGGYEILLQHIHPEDRVEVKATISHALSSGEGLNMFHRLLLSGKIKYVHIIAEPIFDDGGQVIRLLGTCQDVTALKEAELAKENYERRLQQAHKLEAIGTLAGGIAHDFNNILTSIIGYTQLVLREVDTGSTIAKRLDLVLQAGLRAKDLVAQILTFSRETERKTEPIRLDVIVKEAVKLLRASIPANVEIERIIMPDCGYVGIDPIHVHQLIMNVCTNAYHAIGHGPGKICLEVSPATLGPGDLITGFDAQPGEYVHLKISDTGHGIAQEDKEKIFNPYFTTKKRGEGTGLGLSVVHGIVKKNSGQIAVCSRVGEGTQIDIFLPCAKQSRSVCPADKASPLIGGEEHIVVVDDEQGIATMLAEFLQEMGYRVTSFVSSEQARVFLLDPGNAYDLLITDMFMPRLCGDQLAADVLRKRPELPVIICSGSNDQLDEATAKSMGIREYLIKPFSVQTIGMLVRRLLDTCGSDSSREI